MIGGGAFSVDGRLPRNKARLGGRSAIVAIGLGSRRVWTRRFADDSTGKRARPAARHPAGHDRVSSSYSSRRTPPHPVKNRPAPREGCKTTSPIRSPSPRTAVEAVSKTATLVATTVFDSKTREKTFDVLLTRKLSIV